MGLSIGYQIRARAVLSPEKARRLLGQWAREIRRAQLGRPGPITAVDPARSRFQYWITQRLNDTDSVGLNVPPRSGFSCTVEIGAGCEPLVLGLCRYPGRVTLGGRVRAVPGGWYLRGFCKTEYAALHGLDHFVDCHRRVIAILGAMPYGAVNVAIDDEGGFWPHRDERRLRTSIVESQRGIAGHDLP